MKLYSLLFITFLYTISCTNVVLNFRPSEDEINQNLVEISKEPLSEGIFATMATQLSSQGGFDRVLSLLHQLVRDGKDQLHHITKTWRRVKSRCDVSAYMYSRRTVFFESSVRAHERVHAEKTEENAEQKGLLDAYRAAVGVYRKYLSSAMAREANFLRSFQDMSARAKEVLQHAKSSRQAVQDWTPKGAALVQTMLSKMVTSYVEISGHQIEAPVELVERSSDTKIRSRLVQWFDKLILRTLSLQGGFEVSKKRAAKGKAHISFVQAFVNKLENTSRQIENFRAENDASIKSSATLIQLYTKLEKENKALKESNTKYCANETSNFNRNKSRINEEIKLFNKIINYFLSHYKRVHDFIRNKYNR